MDAALEVDGASWVHQSSVTVVPALTLISDGVKPAMELWTSIAPAVAPPPRLRKSPKAR